MNRLGPAYTDKSRSSAISLLLDVTVAVGFIAFLAMFAYRAAAILCFPYDLAYGEGNILTDAVNLFSGRGVYAPFDLRSPTFPVYAPLFQFLTGLIMLVTGPSLRIGRLLSVCAAVTTAI